METEVGAAGKLSKFETELVQQHLGLVNQVVNQMLGRLPRFVARDDLVSAGMTALVQSARNYDDSRQTGFERYACPRIRGALLDEMRSRDWASRSVRSRGRRLLGAVEDLSADLGRTPTTAELAGHLGVSAESVTAIGRDVERARVLSFDGLLADDPDLVLAAGDADPEAVLVERERRAYVLDGVAALPDRLRTVVVGYFFEERTSQELADELGVSTSRISQMRSQALLLLREAIQAQLEPARVAPATTSPLVTRRRAAYAAAVAAGSGFRSRLIPAPARTRPAAGH
ncbi:MAG: sigma-70 family RNA polymerase sigma factor [Acidimicrobiales bacterium]